MAQSHGIGSSVDSAMFKVYVNCFPFQCSGIATSYAMTTQLIQDLKDRSRRLLRQISGRDLKSNVQISCRKEYHGMGFGRWCICPEGLNSSSVVYSFGIGEDITFDLSMIEKFGVTIHAFDPTPKSLQWLTTQTLPQNFVIHEYGLAAYDGVAAFAPPRNPNHVSHTMLDRDQMNVEVLSFPVRTLQTIMNSLQHSNIDLLKIDIEGAEYAVIDQILASNVQIKQMLVELHHRFAPQMLSKSKWLIKNMNLHGYLIFNISPSGEEYSFIQRTYTKPHKQMGT